jgi:Ca2+-binding EF-hand superfamily protein
LVKRAGALATLQGTCDTVQAAFADSGWRHAGQNLTFDELADMVNEVDQDGNGEVDFDEFLFLMFKKKKEADMNDLDIMEAFRIFDRVQRIRK